MVVSEKDSVNDIEERDICAKVGKSRPLDCVHDDDHNAPDSKWPHNPDGRVVRLLQLSLASSGRGNLSWFVPPKR